METPADVKTWRREVRGALLERRRGVTHDDRRRISKRVGRRILASFGEFGQDQVGIYWPIRGEIDLRPLAPLLAGNGCQTSLPVITGRREPLSFASWTPETRMVRGTWNIPIPAQPVWVQPTVLLIPVLGFDRACYRLGYGGGYYDRTLAAMEVRPLTIGVGYELGRLESIFPQPHDIPLDAIVTEASLTKRCLAE